MNIDAFMQKNQASSHVEVKTVTWSKDSHGLFDYESKNINSQKYKIDSSTELYKEGNEITLKNSKEPVTPQNSSEFEKNYLFSVTADKTNEDRFFIHIDETASVDNDKSKNAFLIVRSLKNEEGVQNGYTLELGDIIRLGRIEYRLIEYQDEFMNSFSLLNDNTLAKSCPFTLFVKDCNVTQETKRQCRICLMDEEDDDEPLVNPCNCKGTSADVHIKCLQDWIGSKVKRKNNLNTTCSYLKKLNCEVCKISLPDLVDLNGEKKQLIPITRPETPYILLERVFYDKSKSTNEHSKAMILLSLSNNSHQIKIGRGHECDLRENDISVSRLHAFIKYQNGQFVVFDNNSKFGTLIMLRRNYNIEKKKIALQVGRTVITFSLKQSSVNNVPVFKNPMLMEKLTKLCSPMASQRSQLKTSEGSPKGKVEADLNGSFLD